MGFDWNGDVEARVIDASRRAVNDTVDAARDDARETHDWQNSETKHRTRGGAAPGEPRLGSLVDTHLERQIKSRHSAEGALNPTAKFGYTRQAGFYGAFHEEGTTHEHRFPTLRPAGDRNFPSLAGRIARELDRA